MTDVDINKAGTTWFGKKWAGVGSADKRFKPLRDRYFVVNTGHEGSKGIHWVAGYRSPRGQVYTFDSFGREAPETIPDLARRVVREGHGIIADANRLPIQSDNTDVCGHLSLAYLNTIHLAGLTSTERMLNPTPALRRELAADIASSPAMATRASKS